MVGREHHATPPPQFLSPDMLGSLRSATLSSSSSPLSLLPTPGEQMRDGGQVGSSWSSGQGLQSLPFMRVL